MVQQPGKEKNRRIPVYKSDFWAAPSPYILQATLQQHVRQFQDEYAKTTKVLLDDTYVDDVQSGGESISELETFKEQARTIIEKGGFHST